MTAEALEQAWRVSISEVAPAPSSALGPDSIRRLRGTLVSRQIPWLRVFVEGVVTVRLVGARFR